MTMQVSSTGAGDRRFYTLDGMRGVAAIAVALCHLSPVLAPAGYIAVDLFFMMSGVVLVQAYVGRLRRGMSLKTFLEIRLIRLYPLYIAGSLIGFVVSLVTHALSPKQMLVSIPSALLMLPAPLIHNGQLYPFNPPAWSLFFELIINIWLAVALHRSSKALLVMIMVVSALALIPLADQHYHLNLGFRINPVQLLGGAARVGFSFVGGILLFRRQGGSPRTASSWAPVILAATVLMLIVPAPVAWLASRDLLLALVVSPLLVFGALQVEPPTAWRRPFQVLGDISYPLYALHFPTIILWQGLFGRLGLPLVLQASIFTIVLVVIAALAARFYDEPVRAMLSRISGRRESSPPQLL